MQALVLRPSEQATSRIGIQPHLRANRMLQVVLSSQLTINTPLDMALPTKGTRSKSTHRGQEPVPSTRKPAQTPEPTLHARQQTPEARTTTLQLVETCTQARSNVRTGHGTTDWFKTRKGVCQECILSPCLFNLYAEYIIETLGWMKHKLESRLPGEITITSDMQMTPSLWQKVKKN